MWFMSKLREEQIQYKFCIIHNHVPVHGHSVYLRKKIHTACFRIAVSEIFHPAHIIGGCIWKFLDWPPAERTANDSSLPPGAVVSQFCELI
jgi:hypothetical protein